MNRSVKRFYISAAALLAALLIFDRITKILAVTYLKGTEGITLIEGSLKLLYLENRGAAFGIFQNMQPLFIVLTIAFFAVAAWFIFKLPKTKRYMPVGVCILFLIAGALGNFIDRIAQSYVVDFIYFEIIDFPIFNVADIYVTLSVATLILLVLFYYKEGDFAFLKKKDKSENE